MEMYPSSCFDIEDEKSFQQIALQTFRKQSRELKVYKEYLEVLKINPDSIRRWEDIPYLPIEFFRTKEIILDGLLPELIFQSSGSTSNKSSKHFVADLKMYERSFVLGFEKVYGSIEKYCILALLPSYLEKGDSSLVYMTDHLIRKSEHAQSGFYLNNYHELSQVLKSLKDHQQKTILLGVSYALLDLAEQFPLDFTELIIMETGGMKGRRKELLKEELHAILKNSFHVKAIHSEYGMTELLSQAYSQGEGKYTCPKWMRLRIREMNDPFSFAMAGKTGGICITDLANLNSCSFLATQDLGRIHADGSFEVLGRFDDAEARGCNLMLDF